MADTSPVWMLLVEVGTAGVGAVPTVKWLTSSVAPNVVDNGNRRQLLHPIELYNNS